jgi:tetratricopeptide (TPR) repeat protein
VTAYLRSRRGIPGDVTLPHENLPGEEIAGPGEEDRYAVLGEIARGGMGIIVQILDNDIRRPVAMKVCPAEDRSERAERFIEEAQITGQLEHPNIVPVHELGVDPSGKVYFTMKLVRGESLEAILGAMAKGDREASEKDSLSRLLQIFLKVCDAVAFAHSKGVIHRDLKPENIMVGKFGEVLVMDWGLSKARGRGGEERRRGGVRTVRSEEAEGQTLEGEVMGTPAYMPPEQADGRIDAIDERSDIFALGAVLYQMLTFDVPYTGQTLENVLLKAVEGRFVPPRKRAPSRRIPVELESICLKAMAPEKGDRYGSVEALIRDVRAYQDHRPVSAHRYRFWTRFARFVQRHPAASLTGSIGLVLAVAVVAVTGVLIQRVGAGRAMANEQVARGEAERARAEVAGMKARIAEREREKAERRADSAEAMLRKGRSVSAVLRSADVELGEVLKSLKKSYYSTASVGEKRRKGDALWGKVEAFERTVPADSASRAAWLAAKGWLRRLAGYEEEGKALFRESNRVDGDVAYGWFFEGMMYLSKYLEGQVLPVSFKTGSYWAFGEIPLETEGMEEARDALERILTRVQSSRIWGESSAKDFGEVLSALRAIRTWELEMADRGLVKALSIPEMIWLREEFGVVRAQVMYLLSEFQKGIEVLERVAGVTPDDPAVHFYLGNFWDALARSKNPGEEQARRFFEKAIQAYGETIRRDPDLASARNGRGLAYTHLGDCLPSRDARGEATRKAIEDFTEALRLAPKNPIIQMNRGVAFGNLGDWMASRGEDPTACYKNAIRDQNEILRDRPKLTFAHGNLAAVTLRFARFLFSQGKDTVPLLEKAIDTSSYALSLTPSVISLWLVRGSARMELGRVLSARGKDPRPALRSAVQDFTEALARDPESLPAKSRRGLALKNLGEAVGERGADPGPTFRDAIQDFDAVLKEAPARASAWTDRGGTYLCFGRALGRRGRDPLEMYRKAIQDFERSLEIDPGQTASLVNRGMAATEVGERIAAQGKDPLSRYEAAIRDCDEALRRNPELAEAYRVRGTAKMNRGKWHIKKGGDPRRDYRSALVDFTEAIRRSRADPRLYTFRGNAHYAMGVWASSRGSDPTERFRNAIRDYTVSLKLNPQDPNVYYNLGTVWLNLGLVRVRGGEDSKPAYEKSLLAYREAVRRQPRNWRALANIGFILENWGRYAQALQVYQDARKIAGDRAPELKDWIARVKSKMGK